MRCSNSIGGGFRLSPACKGDGEMNIPDPKANYGDTVWVHNYRSKPKDGSQVWEEGEVKYLEYGNSYGSFSWSYEIRLNRQTHSGNPIFLHVGNDKISSNPIFLHVGNDKISREEPT